MYVLQHWNKHQQSQKKGRNKAYLILQVKIEEKVDYRSSLLYTFVKIYWFRIREKKIVHLLTKNKQLLVLKIFIF